MVGSVCFPLSLLGKLIIGTSKGFIRGKALSVEGHTHTINDIETSGMFKINKFIDKTYSLDGTHNLVNNTTTTIIDKELINSDNIFTFSNGFMLFIDINIKNAKFTENNKSIGFYINDKTGQIDGTLIGTSIGPGYTANTLKNTRFQYFILPTCVSASNKNSDKSISISNGTTQGNFIRATKYEFDAGCTVNFHVDIRSSVTISNSSYIKLKLYTFSF